MKQRIVLISVLAAMVVTTGCSHVRENRMVKGYNGSAWVDPGTPKVADDIPDVTESPLERIAEQAKKQHGLMHIHRYGEGYDILLTLDAGDSDVQFVMDLPRSAAEQADDAQPVSEEGPSAEDVAAEEQGEASGRISDKEVAKLGKVESMTKHVLNAQSLFYKKQYWEALDETNEAILKVPDSAQAHALKGSIYYKMGLLPEAKASWEEALRLDPELDQVKASLARLR
ncbi:tetratricopeptide repeat protein [uncultured Thalassolituus sp.]|uniref:tetratricopeptide repeat protein n=1 Tax=uncultured Thalassolituus sp. TaxID=285273 RepID=UPI00262B8F44|nr:tetratricopeptide repeat protein [uncultured Thalassolituus sp.]